ncbi:MAG: autotransporter domain-containing protein, partial [Brevundimonas sp.]|uniref:autotransporter family protein n=1 Tax=Brevundimonas sp. TaxID=1871086 RepID=UPI002721CAB3
TLSPSGVVTTLAVVAQPTNGTVTITGTTATYAPTAGFFGTDSFTYTATGPGGTSAPATVSVTVATPPPPVIVTPPPIVPPPSMPGAPVILELGSSSDGTVEGFRLTGAPAGGDATIEEEPIASAGGKGADDRQAVTARRFRLVYRPRADFLGQDRLTLVAFGPGGTSAPATFTFNITGRAPDLDGRSASNATVRFRPTATLTGGPFQSIRVTQPPVFGTVVVEGLEMVFTAALTDSGSTSFAYVIDLPFGTSAAGTARVVTDLAPIPAQLSATTEAGRPVTVDLTVGAQGGPFTGAAVLAVTPSTAGTTTITEGGPVGARTYSLTYTPSGQFTGTVEVTFSLSNAAATGPGLLRLTVTPRPDPSNDPEVRGVITSQIDSARRFTDTQIGNFSRRLAQLREGRNDSRSDLSLNLGFARGLAVRDPLGGFPQEIASDPSRDPDGDFLGLVANRDRPATNDQTDRSHDFGAPSASNGADEASPGRIGVWATGTLDWGRRDAVSGARDYRIATSGLSAGVDMRVTPSLFLGVGAGYGRDRTEIGDNGSLSQARSATGAVYGSWRAGAGLFVDGTLGWTQLDFDTRRWISATGTLAQGRRDGAVTFGSLAAGWSERRGTFDWSAYARAQRQAFDLDPFTETGAGMNTLRYEALAFDSVSATLGVRGGWALQTSRGRLSPRFQFEWEHEFEAVDPQGVRYDDWRDSPLYRMDLGDFGKDEWTFDLGLGWQGHSGQSLSLGYRGRAGSDLFIQGLDVSVSTRF